MANDNTADMAPAPNKGETSAEEIEVRPEGIRPEEETDPSESDSFEQPELTREERVMHKFFGCMQLLHHRKRPRMAQGQGRLLAILIRTGKVSQRDLQDMTGIRSASLSELLKKLESNGYIAREQNEEDRRSVDISLTEAGTAEAERLRAERDAGRNLFSALSEEELEQLELLLSKLLKAWDPEGEFSPHNPDRKGRRGEFGRGRGKRGRKRCEAGRDHEDCESHGRRGRGREGFDERRSEGRPHGFGQNGEGHPYGQPESEGADHDA